MLDLFHVLGGEGDDSGPHVIFVFDEPLLLEPVEGLPNGGTAHPKGILKLIDVDPAAQGKAQGDDIVAQALVDLVYQGAFFDCGHNERYLASYFLQYMIL